MRRQGRHHQGDHRAREPARFPRRGAARAVGSGEDADVHAALHGALPGGAAKSSSSIAAGTTAPGSNTSWDSAAKEQHKRFLELCPQIEKYIVDAGIILIKIWLEVGKEEQERRFEARIEDPLRQWKLSPMDVESYRALVCYSRARDLMLKATDTKHAPWHIVRSDDKRRARLNCIAHILKPIPYKKVKRDKIKLPQAIGQGQIRRPGAAERKEFRC